MKWMLLAALAVTGCKQGRGDRCQIDQDCQSGLVCSAATGTCTDLTTGGIDASTVIDAPRQMDAPADQ